jgi:hypothetical protein
MVRPVFLVLLVVAGFMPLRELLCMSTAKPPEVNREFY